MANASSSPSPEAGLHLARVAFHKGLLTNLLTITGGVASNADSSSRPSKAIAGALYRQIGEEVEGERLVAQTSGKAFEDHCAEFLRQTFPMLHAVRPGEWTVECVGGRNRLTLARFAQYEHLSTLHDLAEGDPKLKVILGGDYTITPDIVVSRARVPDALLNTPTQLVDEEVARLTDLRARNGASPLLHASISCKWTLRSDRAQNARSEALNLIRLRKGAQPHIAVITGEPMPSRIASIALGTGDIDCVYHFALPELVQAVGEVGAEDAAELLTVLIEGKRLRDIADLPLDLAV